MPIYEYRCDKCAKTHEIIQKFSDPVVTECPDCKGPVAKQMSLAAFHLKGSGWYQTDYKKPSSSQSESTVSAPAPAAKSDSKSGGDGGK